MNSFSGQLMNQDEIERLNSLQLAYIGDTVWELIIRQQLVQKKMNVKHMHNECIKFVNAHAQACFLKAITIYLTEKEKEIVHRGRNAHARHPVPRNQEPEDYAASTAFEALIGFLYLSGNLERIESLYNMIDGGTYHG